MPISKDTITQVSNLARIELLPSEFEKLSGQLEEILDFIDTLKKIDVRDIPPMSHILPVNNVLRDDTPCESLPSDKALLNAPHKEGNFFVVPKVIE